MNSEHVVSNPLSIFKVCHKVPFWVRPTLSSFYINDKRLLVPPRYTFMLMIQSSPHLAHIHPPSQPHNLHLCLDMYDGSELEFVSSNPWISGWTTHFLSHINNLQVKVKARLGFLIAMMLLSQSRGPYSLSLIMAMS